MQQRFATFKDIIPSASLTVIIIIIIIITITATKMHVEMTIINNKVYF